MFKEVYFAKFAVEASSRVCKSFSTNHNITSEVCLPPGGEFIMRPLTSSFVFMVVALVSVGSRWQPFGFVKYGLWCFRIFSSQELIIWCCSGPPNSNTLQLNPCNP